MKVLRLFQFIIVTSLSLHLRCVLSATAAVWCGQEEVVFDLLLWQNIMTQRITFTRQEPLGKENRWWGQGKTNSGLTGTSGRPPSRGCPQSQDRWEKEGGEPKQIGESSLVERTWRCYRGVKEKRKRRGKEDDAGQEVLRENVYRLWFINSWAVSKSSRSSESLWVEAKKGRKWRSKKCANKPMLVGFRDK